MKLVRQELGSQRDQLDDVGVCPPSIPDRRKLGIGTKPRVSMSAFAKATANPQFFSDRKLKKATNANCVRHRESSIKTITRKNFGRVPTSPTLLPASKEQVAGLDRARRDPLVNSCPR